MNFLELAKRRQSVRSYSSKPVEPEKLERCLEAARIAPSASNSQPWKFIVIDEASLREQVAKATYGPLASFNSFVLQAPALVVIVIEKPKIITQVGITIKKKEWPLVDIGIAAEHFCLQATEESLGTCMLGWFKEKKIKKLLGIPKNKLIGLIITVGYPSEDYPLRHKSRKSPAEVIRYNRY